MQTTIQAPVSEAVNRDGLWPMPPGPPHEEKHFTRNEVVRDLVTGAAGGLTLPFALAAGLSSAAVPSPGIVIVPGAPVHASSTSNLRAKPRTREVSHATPGVVRSSAA